MALPVEAYFLEKKKNISRPVRSGPRDTEQEWRKRSIIFISTEPVSMNNLLPAGGESLYDFSGSEKS